MASAGADGSAPGPPERPRGSWLARLGLVVAGPLVFLGLLELLLATFGFGGRPPLFIPSPTLTGMLETNPAVAQRYFPGRETKLAIDPIPFFEEKPEGVIRLVVQGGSTAAGFPYGRFGGLAGMLGDRLEAARPEQTIEVISTAMAAVNSYTLLDFVPEIIEIEPDAVLIYAGHNEYLGIFGAGSALTAQRSRTATRLHLALGRFRVYQLFDLLIPSAAEATQERESGSRAARTTLMAHAASSAEIAIDSETFRDGLLQYEENIDAILSAYSKAGIPVYLATIASNEVDQAPFVGTPATEAERSGFEAELASVRARLRAGDDDFARAPLREVVARFPDAATAHYALARAEQAAGDFERARAHFRAAKEFDRLRFRAPEAINATVRRLAALHAATLVDVQAHLEAHSPIGRVGRDLMLEHLHPNAHGYFLLADGFYRAIEATALLGPPPAEPPPDVETARRDMPLTAIDRLNAAQLVREIISDFPFRAERVEVPYPEPKGPIQRIAREVFEDPSRWLDAQERLLQLHLQRGEFARAVVVARVTARLFPGEASPNRAAARLLARMGRWRQAIRYQEAAHRAEPDDLATLEQLRRMRAHVARGGDANVPNEPNDELNKEEDRR